MLQKGNRSPRDLGIILFVSDVDTKQFVVIRRRNAIVVDTIIQCCVKVNLETVGMKTELQKMHELMGRRNQSLIYCFM